MTWLQTEIRACYFRAKKLHEVAECQFHVGATRRPDDVKARTLQELTKTIEAYRQAYLAMYETDPDSPSK